MTEVLQQEIRTLKNIFESERDPEGRVFAPLADAYRRSGEIQQAVRLLNAGLARHPHFVPGHVVAAQLYVEQGLAAEATIAARAALELDGDNVNALASLLRVLEDQGDEEAADVRSRLLALEPDFAVNGQERATYASRLRAEPALTTEAGSEPFAVDSEADTVELGALRIDDRPPVMEATEAPAAASPELDLMPLLDFAPPPEAGVSGDEPVIDLDSLASVDGVGEFDEEPAMVLPTLDPETELAVEEPIIDLDSLAPVGAEAVDDFVALDDLAAESAMELPTEEPVIDLDELAAVATDDDSEVMSLADLAPDPEEAVMDLGDLAPDPEEAVMELGDLAPDPEEAVMDLGDLAPDAEEAVMDLGDLAPDAEEAVMDLGDLAPDPEEAVMDLGDLAPDAEEAVMDLGDLAPDPEEAVMDLGDLAPDPEEAVVELGDLAPEPEEPVVDLADLAPQDDEPVVDLGALAPDEPVDDGEMTMMDLMARVPEAHDVIIDMDALKPSFAAVDEVDDEANEAPAPAQELDSDGPGEPVYTRTLGELYVKQGAVDQAIEVFRHLRDVNPDDTEIARRLEELESGEGIGGAEDAGDPDEEVETLARELAEGGHHVDEVESPFAWADDGDAGEQDEEARPTIGDYFERLFTWKPGGDE
ncbi:MAG: hypothetical protein OEN00_15970 [Gemmatimonadota bacterium]|nr:hypothetical protein [Gemmatimonadota bacterium]